VLSAGWPGRTIVKKLSRATVVSGNQLGAANRLQMTPKTIRRPHFRRRPVFAFKRNPFLRFVGTRADRIIRYENKSLKNYYGIYRFRTELAAFVVCDLETRVFESDVENVRTVAGDLQLFVRDDRSEPS